MSLLPVAVAAYSEGKPVETVTVTLSRVDFDRLSNLLGVVATLVDRAPADAPAALEQITRFMSPGDASRLVGEMDKAVPQEHAS